MKNLQKKEATNETRKGNYLTVKIAAVIMVVCFMYFVEALVPGHVLTVEAPDAHAEEEIAADVIVVENKLTGDVLTVPMDAVHTVDGSHNIKQDNYVITWNDQDPDQKLYARKIEQSGELTDLYQLSANEYTITAKAK